MLLAGMVCTRPSLSGTPVPRCPGVPCTPFPYLVINKRVVGTSWHRDTGTPGQRDTGTPGYSHTPPDCYVTNKSVVGTSWHRDTGTPGHRDTGTPWYSHTPPDCYVTNKRVVGTPGHRDTGTPGYSHTPPDCYVTTKRVVGTSWHRDTGIFTHTTRLLAVFEIDKGRSIIYNYWWRPTMYHDFWHGTRWCVTTKWSLKTLYPKSSLHATRRVHELYEQTLLAVVGQRSYSPEPYIYRVWSILRRFLNVSLS